MCQSPPRFEPEALRQAIRDTYASLASGAGEYPFHFGRPLARRLGYDDAAIARLPQRSVAAFAGAGNPFAAGPIPRGATVVDVGCGAGVDLLLASELVGPDGKAIGVDMTPAMVGIADSAAQEFGADQVSLVEGFAEELPLPDACVDVVLSNDVVNLCLDKGAVFEEFYRILKPGGSLYLGDVLVRKPILDWARDLIHLWTECVAGSLPLPGYLSLIRAAGFGRVELVGTHDVISGAPVERTAGYYDSIGHTLRAVKKR